MSDTNEPSTEPSNYVGPAASYDVVKETYQGPTASSESVKTDSAPPISVDTVKFGQDCKPTPSIEYEKRGLSKDK